MKSCKIFIFILIASLLLIGCTTVEKHNCEDFISDWIVVKDGLCGETIKRKKICTKCEKTLEKETVVKEHEMLEGIIQELTCTQDGIIQYTCALCGVVEDKTIPATGHNFIEEEVQELTCTQDGIIRTTCEYCGQSEVKRTKAEGHDYTETVLQELSCTKDGVIRYECNTCGQIKAETTPATGHITGDANILRAPSDTLLGHRTFSCANCNEDLGSQYYVDNGYFKNGKLKVVGPDLVNERGEKVQLFGLSTHGLQWFGRYANFKTIAAIQEGFGNNIIRFAFYTDENGYCDGNEAKKKQMLADLMEGIDAATKLGLYVIVDWHMVGAENVADKNPLTYMAQSKEFFSFISNHYKDQDNILYEIMNEPNGSTTWADCKKYAETIIPCIRKNTDAIVLVGNPKWTADLTSVMNDPLVGFKNIMYTYHFYAADHTNTSQVVRAYDSGFPVFISEFGFMLSSGDGDISESSGNNWKTVLDTRNISYVAWNISNSKGSASIFKYNSGNMTSVEDSNLKVWGVYLKNWYREKSGLNNLSFE